MTKDHIGAVTDFGFTSRQATFLVTVMQHAGVCLNRQYCAFARIQRGQVTHDFFSRLVTRGFARTYPCGHPNVGIYHIHHKPLYRAIGDPDSRLRRPAFLGRMVERLMLLDAVLDGPDITWLTNEREKLAHFLPRVHGRLHRQDLPSLTFGVEPQTTVRYFPDRLPIGLSAADDSHVFLYLVTQSLPADLRAFLHRHAELLRALPRWTIRLLIPRHLVHATLVYRNAFREEMMSPLSAADYEELHWYFDQRQRLPGEVRTVHSARFQRAHHAFALPRFRALYRAWIREGEAALHAARSPLLADAIERGTGRLETTVLPHLYHHLLPLVGTA